MNIKENFQSAVYWYIVNVEGAILQDGKYLTIIRGLEETHAPGILALPGGKVENAGNSERALEETLHREIAEEVGIQVWDGMAYVESSAFIADDGDPVIDIVFLCRYQSGTPHTASPAEVADVRWMTLQQILAHPKTSPWTRRSVEAAERKRIELGW